MIKIENTEVTGWEAAIRGMRNPMNSWDRSDSYFWHGGDPAGIAGDKPDTTARPYWAGVNIGPNDRDLMMRLVKAGPVDAKFRRMIVVTADVTAPLYWWKEADTYRVGTVANSCSTMHKIHAKPFELVDFSWDQLLNTGLDLFEEEKDGGLFKRNVQPVDFMVDYMIPALNKCREKYLETKDKVYWWQMIQLLPSSYNQKRTFMLNYEVLAGIYPKRKNHKLDEWREFCGWIEALPYSELITGAE